MEVKAACGGQERAARNPGEDLLCARRGEKLEGGERERWGHRM